MTATEWYWCLTHQRAETADRARRPGQRRSAPTPAAADAADWKRINEERALKWKVEDEQWTGEESEA